MYDCNLWEQFVNRKKNIWEAIQTRVTFFSFVCEKQIFFHWKTIIVQIERVFRSELFLISFYTSLCRNFCKQDIYNSHLKKESLLRRMCVHSQLACECIIYESTSYICTYGDDMCTLRTRFLKIICKLGCLSKITSSTFSEQIHVGFLPIPAKSSDRLFQEKVRNRASPAWDLFFSRGWIKWPRQAAFRTVLHSCETNYNAARSLVASIGSVLFVRSGTRDSRRHAVNHRSQWSNKIAFHARGACEMSACTRVNHACEFAPNPDLAVNSDYIIQIISGKLSATLHSRGRKKDRGRRSNYLSVVKYYVEERMSRINAIMRGRIVFAGCVRCINGMPRIKGLIKRRR